MKNLLLFCVLIVVLLSACAAPNLSLKWFKNQEISKGLKPQPSYTINKAEFEKQYLINKAVWDKAIYWIKTQDLENLAVGKYPIDGENAFASITEMVDKPQEDTRWESHRKFIDLQYIIKGKEKIGIAPTAGAKVINPYNSNKDIANYEIDDARYAVAVPKFFFLFFSTDAHRPNVKVNEEKVKKLVIKIRVAD